MSGMKEEVIIEQSERLPYILEQLRSWLSDIPVGQRFLAQVALFAVAIFLAWLANYITKQIIVRIVRRMVKKSKTHWDDILAKRKVFTLFSHLAPALVINFFAPVVFINTAGGAHFLESAAIIYMIFIGILVLNALLNSVTDVYDTYEFSRRIPIHGIMQVIKLIVFIAGGIIILSLILDRNPTTLLAGFGAMTAVVSLIFKDVIVGFVSGIQLSANNMVHIGDWIEMPKYGADGDVFDISLTTVKVRNWDKTISTIPAYALINDSFKNWRGMSESGGRRIKRSINIDMNSIKFSDSIMLDKFRRFQCLSDYINNKESEISEYNNADDIDDTELINGRRLTNIGTFRAYVIAYLKNHPKINQNMTFLVRQLQPTENGLPIEIYVFSSDKVWANYEAIQADIFDHILAAVPQFDLRVHQNPTGSDFTKLMN